MNEDGKMTPETCMEEGENDVQDNEKKINKDMFSDMFGDNFEVDKLGDIRSGLGENPNLMDNWDDAEGYYRVRIGEVLDSRLVSVLLYLTDYRFVYLYLKLMKNILIFKLVVLDLFFWDFKIMFSSTPGRGCSRPPNPANLFLKYIFKNDLLSKIQQSNVYYAFKYMYNFPRPATLGPEPRRITEICCF